MTDTPRRIKLIMASLRRELPADDGSYGWEVKWDGVRAIVYVDDGDVALMSRNDKDMAGSYPELGALVGMVDELVILDDEIVALRDGRPGFGLLQSRMHVQHPNAPADRGNTGHLLRVRWASLRRRVTA